VRTLVTGAAGFIGSTLVDRLLADGHSVVGYDNLSTGRVRFLESAAANPNFRFVNGDLLDKEALTRAMKGAEFAFHLAANADVRFGREHPERDLEQNTVATFNLNRLSAAHMSTNEPEDEERGVLINTASIAAFEGQIGQVAYTAAKAGIAGMTFTMARDLGGLGIRVNAIAPSLFSTGITEGIPDEFAAALTKDAAFPKRMGVPDEYARLAVSIIENPMLNGGTIRLDGGQRFAPK